MKNYVILIAVIFLITGCESKKEQQSFSGVVHSDSDYAKAGTEYLKKGDIKEAITSFETAIKKDPKNPENYITLGQVYLHLKHPEVAAEVFSVATNVDRMNGEAFYLLGLSKGLNGDRSGAIEDIKKSVEIFMQNKDQEKMKRSLILLKSLTEEQTGPQANAEEAMPKSPEQVLGASVTKMQDKMANSGI